MIPFAILWHYIAARRRRFTRREDLTAWQTRRLRHFCRRVLRKSPWFRQYLNLPFERWPQMDKAQMMAHFDEMNTAGLRLETLQACARQSEQSRDFRPRVGHFSVGLSSGTSGRRGLFVVSPAEQRIWAGTILAKVLPDGLFAGERVALFLRADNNLYQSVNNRWLSLAFYDLLSPFPALLTRLQTQNPTLIVAPAQVLRALALAVQDGRLSLNVKKVISVAEVLEHRDRIVLEQVFGCVGEIYQATEGFLAATCAHGTLHLNEEFLHIEPLWLDAQRFIPLITDFTRRTQPIVRYRLDDVLVVRETPCPCGSAAMAIARIEGRQDDQLVLPDSDGNAQTIFADACSRILATSLPPAADYRLLQTGPAALRFCVDADDRVVGAAKAALETLFSRQGIDCGQLRWTLENQVAQMAPDIKRRRIIRQWGRE